LAQRGTVLTPETRSGIFRYMVGAANTAAFVDPTGRPTVPACGTVTTNCYRTVNLVQADPLKRGLDKLMQSQINLTNLPNDFSAGDGFNQATFRFNAAASAPVDNYTGRVDYRVTSNHSTFLRWG